MKIGVARTKDVEELSKFYKRNIVQIPYYSEWAKKEEVRKFSKKNLSEGIKDRNRLYLVAKDGNTIAGVSNGHYDAGLYWMDWRLVDKNSRRKGVATKLFKHLEEVLKKKGVHKIWCDCRVENKESKAFLKSMGMKKIASLPEHWYKQDFTLLEKKLIG